MKALFILVIFLACEQTQAPKNGRDSIQNSSIRSSSRGGSMFRSSRSSFSSSGEGGSQDFGFLAKSGYFMNKDVPDSIILKSLNDQAGFEGRFKLKRTVYETIHSLVSMNVEEVFGFQKINSDEELAEAYKSAAEEILPDHGDRSTMLSRIPALFEKARELIRRRMFTLYIEDQTEIVVSTDFISSINEYLTDLFGTQQNSAELLEDYNARLKALESELEDLRAKTLSVTTLLSRFSGPDGAYVILDDIAYSIVQMLKEEYETDNFDDTVIDRIEQAATASCEATTEKDDKEGFHNCMYDTLQQLQGMFSNHIKPDVDLSAQFSAASRSLKALFLIMREKGFAEDTNQMAVEFIQDFAKFVIPRECDPEVDPSNAEFLDALTPITSEGGPFTPAETVKLLEFSSCKREQTEEVKERMLDQFELFFELDKDALVNLGYALYTFSSDMYMFYESMEGSNEQVLVFHPEYLNQMHDIIAEVIWEKEPDPLSLGVDVDQTIIETIADPGERLLLRVICGLTLLYQVPQVDYTSVFDIKGTEEMKRKMLDNWVMYPEFSTIASHLETGVSTKWWSELFKGHDLNLRVMEEDKSKGKKRRRVKKNVNIQLKGNMQELQHKPSELHPEPLVIPPETHELPQETHILGPRCEVSIDTRTKTAPKSTLTLPPAYIQLRGESELDLGSSGAFEQAREECEKKYQVEKNIVKLIHGHGVLGEAFLEQLRKEEDMLKFIEEHGVVREELPEGIHEYVFLRRTTKENPCYESEVQ